MIYPKAYETIPKNLIFSKAFLIHFIFLAISGCSFWVRPLLAGDVLIADDFSGNQHGWNTFTSQENASAAFFDEGILLVENQSMSNVVTTVPGNFDDLRIKVTAKKYSGTDNNFFGVICRYQDNKNYYGFLITSDGYFGIFKLLDGSYQLINSENLEFSKSIKQNENINQIEAVCNDKELILSVNQNLLAKGIDDGFDSGRVGLFAGTYNENNVAIFFDNFVAQVP